MLAPWAEVVRTRPDAAGTVFEALLRSLAHVACHTGQIVMLARTFAGPAWESPSIPRGGSAAYDADPTRERGPG